MFNALEMLMIVIAFGIMSVGLVRRWKLPSGKSVDVNYPDWLELLKKALGQRRLFDRPFVGLAHFCLVWGFIVFILIVILAQTPLRLCVPAAIGLSLILDILGLSMLASTLFLIIRRIIRKNHKKDPWPPKRALLPQFLIMVILLSGFLAEGARLSIVPPNNVLAAPIGWLFSLASPASPSFMQAMLRMHFVFVMLFITCTSFTFMHHIASTSAYLLYKGKRPAQLTPLLDLMRDPLGAATIMDLSKQELREAYACVSCGRCDEKCPAMVSKKPLAPRSIMGKLINLAETSFHKNGESYRVEIPRLLDIISSDEIWACTTCMACVANCPAYLRPMEKIIQMRRGMVLQDGYLPKEAIPVIRNLELYGDVNGKGLSHKADWALNQNVSNVSSSSKTPEVLLWVGCSGAFHPEYQQTTRDFVKLLKAGGVDFGILANQENCCGDPARKMGDEDLFLKLAKKNIDRLKEHNISKIVTLCPHCFNTLKREYPVLGCEVEVIPAVKMVEHLILEGRISMKYPFEKSLTVHDPCYLGRYNGIYESLRTVCRTVPGVTLKELERSKANGFCCGGGGGRMWLHETIGEKINVLRAQDVVEAGVDAVATACPYCLTMMEDGVKTVNEENPPQVIDIISLAADSLG